MSIIINGKTMDEFIQEQAEKGEVLENVCGTQHVGDYCVNRFNGTRIVGGTNHMVLTDNARVTINRGGKRYTLKGERIEKKDGQWYVDGKAVDWDTIGGKYEEENISIEIHGNVSVLSTKSGTVTVDGDVSVVRTTSGDVKCHSAYDIQTMSGNVTCGSVGGSVTTMSGDINRR